ncbi:MAG: Cof-type HAD-IIB family hydrolase [Bacteroidales bacterium]|nr:Cof-type HAD-IIB family hydrolase [Candidatus Colimorpha pelethequi]
MIKAAFFDIDGTLLSFKTHKVSEGTKEAFAQLQAKGIKTFISSGRPKILIPEFPVHFDGYNTMNGGYVFTGDKVLYRNPIPKEESQRYLQFVQERNLTMMAFSEHEMFANRYDPVAIALRNQLEFTMPPLANIEDLMDGEYYQFIALMPKELDAEVAALLPHCRLPRWHPAFSDLVSAGNSKAVGIECLLKHFGIQREETIAFGDGGNDIEMLEYCGIGVAMGNAADEVKTHADFVTTSVDEEGIQQALKKLNVI